MSEENETKKVERDSPKDLYVLQPPKAGTQPDANKTALGHYWGQKWYGAFEKWTVIYDVVDLVRHVEAQCGEKYYIGTLRIGGHGLSDRFRLGNTVVTETPVQNNGTLITSLKVADIKPWLEKIVSYFKPGESYVVIDACLVGNDDDLLKKLSDALGGVPVIAPFDYQINSDPQGSPPRLEGKARACYPDRCFTLNNPRELGF